jgi:hyperosmotically inducible protein
MAPTNRRNAWPRVYQDVDSKESDISGINGSEVALVCCRAQALAHNTNERTNKMPTYKLEATTRTIASTTRLLLAVLVLISTGFAAKQDKDHRDAFVAGDAGESQLAAKVRHELLMLPYYGVFDDIAFKIDGDAVTLIGAVTRPTLKSDAERIVKGIEGVGRVVNQIEVLPLSPMDDQIRMAEYRAIYGDPALSTRYGYRAIPSIHVIVKNGQVTLEGLVANKADSDLVYLRANGVPNVFSVTNNLQIEQNS